MNQIEFHKFFKSPGPVILPVVHVLDEKQATRNVALAIRAGAPGVLLINHDISREAFVPLIRTVRARFPTLWLGVNFLAVTGRDAFPVLGELQRSGTRVDAYWADDARIDEMQDSAAQTEAEEIARVRRDSGWSGLYFGGTCFKKQREVAPKHYAISARTARGWMDVVTTSGSATGHAPEVGKIEPFRTAIGDAPLALASGITCANAETFARYADCFIVGTGISKTGDFHNFDAGKLADLMAVSRGMAVAQGAH